MTELFFGAWELLGPAQDFVVAIAISVVTSIILRLMQERVSLTWGSTSSNFHQFQLGEDGGNASIWTEKFYVQNQGKKPAREIEIVFRAPPTSYNLWPPRDHNRKVLENGNFVLHIPSIAPKELLIVDTIDISLNDTELLAVNCPDVISKPVEFLPNRQFGRLFNSVILYLLFAGLVGTIYLMLRLFVGN